MALDYAQQRLNYLSLRMPLLDETRHRRSRRGLQTAWPRKFGATTNRRRRLRFRMSCFERR
jgi:hypothetical protein